MSQSWPPSLFKVFYNLFYKAFVTSVTLTFSFLGLLSLKKVLHRDRAILAFQTLIFTLKEYVPDGICSAILPPQDPCVADTELLLQTPNLLSAILNGLNDLIKSYSITWKECIESTMLVNLMLALLKNPNLSSRVKYIFLNCFLVEL